MELLIEKGKLKQIKKVTKKDISIIIPDNVTEIGNSAFYALKNIEQVIIPNTVKVLETCSFQDCSSLKQINIPESVQIIGEYSFSNCKSLKSINLPNSIIDIGYSAFVNCRQLEEITLPNQLKTLKTHLFHYCKKLKTIRLPKSLENIDEMAFYQCPNINTIYINNYFNLYEKAIVNVSKKIGYFYLNENTNELVFSKNKLENDCYKKLEYKKYMREFNCSKPTALMISILFSDREVENFNNMKDILSIIIENDFTIDNYKSISGNLKNIKEFNNLSKRLAKEMFNKKSLYDLYKLAYILGAFSDNQIERQRACEFLYNIFDKNLLSGKTISETLKKLKFREFDRELAKFLLNKDNFSVLLSKEDYISDVCNNFEEIREFGRSNKGSQRYHALTLNLCDKYLSKVRFENVTAETLDVSSTIAVYTNNQDSFNKASQIRKEYLKLKKEGKIQDHILGEELKEKVFFDIDQIRKETSDDFEKILKMLSKISNSSFTYEFLSKYDPKNFILGKYCSCCSHLDGTGRGIMKASILHPDCQNLVIKSKSGSIIAKSTLYVNREQGYGIFNNVEINEDFIKDKETKKEIYLKYIHAIKDFLNEYNKKNPHKPLTQINVGMHMNDLHYEISKNHDKAKVLLKGIPVDEEGVSYTGGWQKEQYIIWSENKTPK